MNKILALTIFGLVGQIATAMPCDSGWSCKSKSGKYAVHVQRCRYSNFLGSLESVKINGKNVEGATLTASYDSKSIGGNILAFEVSIPDTKNDAHYLSFELVRNSGRVTERIQELNPGPQIKIGSEAISCEGIE